MNLSRQRLQQLEEEDRQSGRLFYGHLRELNPNFERDKARRENWVIVWSVAGFVAFCLFVGWLCSLPG